MNFLFDVDGTLTPSRQKIDKEFKSFFGKWITDVRSRSGKVFIVTGSDKRKSVQQLGLALWRHISIDGCYQCSGNQLYKRGRLVRSSNWTMSDDLRKDLTSLIKSSPWYGTATNNIEERTGAVNISTIGRDCPDESRAIYYEWDKDNGEREKIVSILSCKYPQLHFVAGGEISIDIYPSGCDKSQVLNDMNENKNVFFGDRCTRDGNDFTIAIMSDIYYNVDSWQQTAEVLKRFL